MNKLILLLLCCTVHFCYAQATKLADTTLLQPVEITAVRAQDKTPIAKTNLGKQEIEKQNTGMDLPFIFNHTPSVTVSSDAGNGIGYTYLRIRGSDASRINVTLNGIPFNDAESQGTFFVDMPDIASSASQIQIQRGVGTSANGTGAFGGSININTNEPVLKSGLEFNNNAGSYHSIKNTLVLHSGLFKKHFTADGRISHVRSDGYIERASSRLHSAMISLTYLNPKNSIRFNFISGKEKTYQAWNGLSEELLHINRRYNSSGTEKKPDPYQNETDNYLQQHFQLFINQKFSAFWKANITAFLTHGKGFYEQYKAGKKLSAYGLPNYFNGADTVYTSDIVRQLWLNNYFYGNIFSAQYEKSQRQIIIGAGWNQYKGKHYGKVTWAKEPVFIPSNFKWYNNNALKNEFSSFVKWTENFSKNWHLFADLQVKKAVYHINGFRDNPTINLSNRYFFINPKAGITYSKGKIKTYFSYAHGSKEPNRDDFEAGINETPKPEYLHDFELGSEYKSPTIQLGINAYLMLYKNQLVHTGKVNDVGAYTRTNIPKSYRSGVEITAAAKISKWLMVNGNITLSRNKIKNFTEYIDDYDNNNQAVNFYKQTNISFSPNIISSATLEYAPVSNLQIGLTGKFISRQFLDNTSQINRSIKPYYTQELSTAYTFTNTHLKEIKLFVQVYNLFSTLYVANGYTFSYIYNSESSTSNYYFPMAPIHFMAGINIKL